MTKSHVRFMVIVPLTVLGATPIFAQHRSQLTSGVPVVVAPQEAGRDDPSAWGPSATTTFRIPAWAFQPVEFGNQFSIQGGFNRFIAAGGVAFAPVMIPEGALVTAVQVTACDESPNEEVTWALIALDATAATEIGLSSLGTTSVAAIPGCGVFNLNLSSPHTINNTQIYYVAVGNSPTPGTVRYSSAAVRYKLQVSPPPGMATFNDVPLGHPQRPFIEALFASGITSGCGSGNYCPDAPLTRGQMAVFLSVALGLHWPN